MEKTIFRLCMQDEARHVAYGVKHLQYFLERHSHLAVLYDEAVVRQWNSVTDVPWDKLERRHANRSRKERGGWPPHSGHLRSK